MNNKVLVEVFLPSLQQSYNVLIPINKRIVNVVALLEKAIVDLSNGYFEEMGVCKLFNEETGKPYDESLTVKETDIRNGTKLIMF